MAYLDKRKFDNETLVGCIDIVKVARVAEIHSLIQLAERTTCRLLLVAFRYLACHFHQRHQFRRVGHNKFAQMRRNTVDKHPRVKTVVAHVFVDEERLLDIVVGKSVDKTEIIVVVKDVEIVDSGTIGDVAHRCGCHLVEYRQGVTHSAVGLLRYHVKSLRLGCVTLMVGNIFQLLGDVGGRDALEVIFLASRKNRWQNFLPFRGGKNENHVFRRLLKRLQKGVERRSGKHVDLIDDKHAVAARDWRHQHLVGKLADVVDTVV